MSLARAAMNSVILEAAKRSQETNIRLAEIADEIGVSKSALTSGKIILEFATGEELDLVTKGKVGISSVADVIRKRMTPEQKTAFVRKGHLHAESDIELWARFKPALDILASLPDVRDVVRIAGSNAGRSGFLKTNLEVATNWLKEFMDEWNNSQRGKSAKNTTDTGTSGPTTGS